MIIIIVIMIVIIIMIIILKYYNKQLFILLLLLITIMYVYMLELEATVPLASLVISNVNIMRCMYVSHNRNRNNYGYYWMKQTLSFCAKNTCISKEFS